VGRRPSHLRTVERPRRTDGDRAAATGVIIAAEGHPFWIDAKYQWLKADQLKPGMWLRTSAGTHVQITAIKTWTQHSQRAHNLTVDNDHTYYVLAGSTPALVHNCGPGDADDLVHVFRAPQRGNGADELANGLNPSRHSGGNGFACTGTEDVAQKYADYSVGTHGDFYIKFKFKRSEFEEHFGTGLPYEGGPGLEWEFPYARIDLFNKLALNKEKLWAPW
jgi:hypothetical protein